MRRPAPRGETCAPHTGPMSDEQGIGERVLQAALAQAKATFGDRLVAAYRLGSLAHGGFSPQVSDVDLGLILGTLEPGDAAASAAIGAHVAADIDAPSARRVSIFYSTWPDLRHGTGAGRFPLVDQLDLRRDGQLLCGVDGREGVPRPTPDDLVVEGARFIVDRLTDPARDALLTDPRALVAAGVREASKAVLFPVRFLVTVATGQVAANPQAAAHIAATRTGPVADVTQAALCWRERGLRDPDDAAALLAAGLPPLYAQLAAGYDARLTQLGHPHLAQAITAWVTRLWPASTDR